MNPTSNEWKNIFLSIKKYAKESKDEAPQKIKNVVSGSILAYRTKHNLTQEELARQLGVTRLQIARWEKAKNKPNKWAIALLKERGVIEKDTV